MAIHILPFEPSLPDQVLGLVLDNNRYLLHAYWNDRDPAWYLDITQPDATPILMGVKIVLGAYIGNICPQPPFSTGAFIAVDSTGAYKEPGLDDLGTRVQVYYVPVLDLIGLQTAYQGVVTGVSF